MPPPYQWQNGFGDLAALVQGGDGQITWKEVPDRLGGEAHYPFQMAKVLLVRTTDLSHPNPHAPIVITTDALDYIVGGVLEQYKNA